jgi:hypothetical protein
MVTLRCTQKLLRRLRMHLSEEVPLSTTQLGDWYCNLLFVRGEQLILCVSESTLLPVLVTAKDEIHLSDRLRAGLREVLSALSIAPGIIEAELSKMLEFLRRRAVRCSAR